MNRILFVCTGNTCRSPMAQAVLKSKKIPDVEVKSAGVFAADGSAASVNAEKVLTENEINFVHKSTQLSVKEVEWATIILTMTASHKDAVLSFFPQAAKKTFTLSEFAGDSVQDIADPYGGSIELYRAAFAEIKEAIDKAARKWAE